MTLLGKRMEHNHKRIGTDCRIDFKELFHLTDQYVIDVLNPSDALAALMFVLAIDAEKCSRN